jgi:class 3 adenylate cyclase/pimeloyl-ACP methyl ester carboxylesterase
MACVYTSQMDPPKTHYIERDNQALAYQLVGDGAHNVVWFFEINNHLDMLWTDPHIHYLLERGASYARTAYFQRRGFGLSGSVGYVPTIEQQADDVLAIMDAADMVCATLAGIFGSCGALALVAARAPERVTGLVLVNPIAQGPLTTTGDLHGWQDRAELENFVAGYREAFENWGSGRTIAMWDTRLNSPYNRRLAGMLERGSATPASARAYFDSILRLDISAVLTSVQTPTRVLRVPTSTIAEGAVRHVAHLIPRATYHTLPSATKGMSIGEAFVPIFNHVEKVATGVSRPSDADRFLGTVVFTDIVSSTTKLADIGDVAYSELRAAHEREVRADVEREGGQMVKITGDGTFSVFDGPSRAVRCALAICSAAKDLGIQVRAGVHTGELERTGPELTGMTVHIGARIGAAAEPGQVLISRTVRDLVVGSGLSFAEMGSRALKGVPGLWDLFVPADADGTSAIPPDDSRRPTFMARALLRVARGSPKFTRSVISLGNRWHHATGKLRH